jgi:nucleoside-diphosphate-sugar epimerase
MSSKSKKHVLVTGGFGYVGSRLTEHLLRLGYPVRVIDLCLYGDYGKKALEKHKSWPQWRKRFSFIRGDLRDAKTLRKATKGIDVIVHLAAISNDPTGDVDEVLTRQVNFDAVGMLLSIARQNKVRRFINASSSSVFGIKNEPNVTETLEPEPITYYSKYKMLSEWLVTSANSKEFCTVNIRPATICGYSPRQRFDLTVNKLTADAIRKNLITVHGGEQRRPNVGMTDVINLYAKLIEIDGSRIAGQTFNFGFENHKIINIAKLIKNELKDLPVSISVTDTMDKRDYHISSSKALKVLRYKPVSSIRQEVAELRRRLVDENCFPNIDAPQYYNMKSMKLGRKKDMYQFLATA